MQREGAKDQNMVQTLATGLEGNLESTCAAVGKGKRCGVNSNECASVLGDEGPCAFIK
jgi:hypothetical protein